MFIELVMPSNYLIFCLPLLLLPSIFPSIRIFFNESALHIRWPKYWSFSFSISPSNEYSGLISFRLIWSPCSPRDSQESSPTPQFKSINSSASSLLYGPAHIFIHDDWQNHSFDYVDLSWQSDLLNPGIEPRSPTLQADSLSAEPQWKPKNTGVDSLSLLLQIFLT